MTPGTRLGPYEITDVLGSGGMGEVYRARDTRLDRDVAIKVLPPHWAQDADMQARFTREAQTIASLNHPNICALHDIGHESPAAGADAVTFLVMELLQGETLAARLERGPLRLDEALDVAVPIADALDQAHRRGVIHRDLKPGNIMLTPSGPKLLDFGIAKTLVSVSPSSPGSKDPGKEDPPGARGLETPGRSFMTTPLTATGLVIGTLQYMAPEQIEGAEADARTDIFAFGVVLHEMVTGKRAFEAKSQLLLISAIATTEPPPLSSVQPATPPALDHVVKACLAKNPDDRWQTARDLVAELRWIADGGATTGPVVAQGEAARGRQRLRLVRVLTVAAAAVAVMFAIPAWLQIRPIAAPDEVRYRIQTPGAMTQDDRQFALSPDGQRVAFVSAEDSRNGLFSALYVGRVGSLTYDRLPGTDHATQPFWSADSRTVGFVVDGTLKKVDASGGPPQPLCPAPSFFGGTWNADGVIVFGSATGLRRVSDQGGTVSAVTTVEPSETAHYWPHFLPDGRRYLYLAWSGDAAGRAVFAGTLDSDGRTLIMPAESRVAHTAAGHLVFARQNAVFAQPFDAAALALSGEATLIADGVFSGTQSGQTLFDVARDGSLLYYDQTVMGGPGGFSLDPIPLQWTWVNFQGANPETVGLPFVYRGAQISPDGRRIAVHEHDGTGGDIWVIEAGGSRRRITFEPAQDNSSPIWSPNGNELVFSSRREGKWGLYRKPSDGAGVEQLLFEDERPKAATSWAPDGARLVFWTEDPETHGDLWTLPMEGPHEPEPVVATPADETHGQISPDGKWFAYVSNRTGDQVEIYVQPFPDGPGLSQISTEGGDWPRWSHDGARLFFLEPRPEAGAAVLSAVPISAAGAALDFSAPEPLVRIFALNLPHVGGDYPTYAVAPDGKRLLIAQIAPAVGAGLLDEATVFTPDSLTLPMGLVVARHWEARIR